MPKSNYTIAAAAAVIISATAHSTRAQWVEFVPGVLEQYISAPPGLVAGDGDQKSYAWADFDQNGRVDLAIARKQPFTTLGGSRNVLLMNEQGVLVDRTNAFISTGDVGQGFLDFTNDSHIIAADLNADGWIDLVTVAAPFNTAPPKHITHPRVYRNLGVNPLGQWQGFVYEDGRIPEFSATPRFLAVAAGDVTGDGHPDLFLVYSELGGEVGQTLLRDRLLINDGDGYFADETAVRLSAEFTEGTVGTAAAILDLNNDGFNDIVKCDVGVFTPGGVRIAYNDPKSQGTFSVIQTVFPMGPTHLSVADLNNDGTLDLVVTNDSADRVFLNQGVGGNGLLQFTQLSLPESPPTFGGTSRIVDLNEDGWNDIIITDVDFEVATCGSNLSGRTHIYRNLANGPNVTFASDPAGIPSAARRGLHDAAIFDIQNDGRLDLIAGRCNGTDVWINVTPVVGDVDGSGTVNVDDLVILILSWGPCPKPPAACAADIAPPGGDGQVNVDDLVVLLLNWD
jgi:hypothetical protein